MNYKNYKLERAKTIVRSYLMIEGDEMNLFHLKDEAYYISETQGIEEQEALRQLLGHYLSDKEEIEVLAEWIKENYEL